MTGASRSSILKIGDSIQFVKNGRAFGFEFLGLFRDPFRLPFHGFLQLLQFEQQRRKGRRRRHFRQTFGGA